MRYILALSGVLLLYGNAWAVSYPVHPYFTSAETKETVLAEDPCANPCGGKANPCGKKSKTTKGKKGKHKQPCGKHPCGGKANPCGKHPCGGKANPCGANPCGGKW